MFELKRAERRTIDVKLGDDIVKADLTAGLKKYGQYLKLKSQLENVSVKVNNGMELTDETAEYFAELVKALLRCIFSESDSDRIFRYFENNSDEIVQQLMPFVLGEYQQALKEERARLSEERANEYVAGKR